MALLLASWLSELVLLLAGGFLGLYLWFSRRYTYWTRKGVPQVEPTFPFGNIRDNILGRKNIGVIFTEAYEQLKGHRFGGIYSFSRPMLMVRDPDIIRSVLVKDFSTFPDRGTFVNENRPLDHNLLNLTGDKWRRLRVKLTPTFTSGKLKIMFSTMDACGREMAEVLDEKAKSGEVLEMKEIAARYTTDIIASVAFGIECHCQEEPDGEFRSWGRKLLAPTFRTSIFNTLSFFNPPLAKFLKISDGNEYIHEYFKSMVRNTVEYREKNNIFRNDFMQLMIQLKNKGFIDEEKSQNAGDNWKLSIEEVAAQAFVFYLAGFETSSTTMSFTLHELSQNPEVQTKLQEEIDTVLHRHGGNLTYEAIKEMTYLHKVVSETLRMYPPITVLPREPIERYKVPDSDLVIEKGNTILIPIYGLHMDPKYYPEPQRYDPERFSEENKAARHPYVYLPFGEGPRVCIGMRLGLLQTKVGLAHLMSKFSVHPTETTKPRIEFDSKMLILSSKDGINLRLQKRK